MPSENEGMLIVCEYILYFFSEGSAANLHYSAEQLVQSFLAPKGAGRSATPRNVKTEVASTVAQIAIKIALSEGCVCFSDLSLKRMCHNRVPPNPLFQLDTVLDD
jgi:hypothetical protein